MKKIIVFINCIFIAVITNAQSPTFQWAKSIGGTNSDLGYSTAIDASGNVYTIGLFNGSGDFDPGPATSILTSAGGEDIYLSKLDASGNFVWVKQFGGALSDEGLSVATDASGNIYTAGTFSSVVDFDPGPGVFNLTSAGSNDIYVSKLDASGNLLWAKNLGGASTDYALSLTLDASGEIYTTGFFEGTADFDPGAATFNLTSVSSGGDIFISKLDSFGNFIWAKDIGGTLPGRSNSITVDLSGNVYTTGYFQATTDFDPGAGTFNATPTGGFDLFILKLDPAGNFVWVKNIGGGLNDIGLSVKTDSFGNVYTGGYFQGTTDFDPGAGTFNVTSVGGYDLFILKLDPAGNFVWVKSMGSSSSDVVSSIAIDASDNIYTAGTFFSTVDFDPGAGIADLTSAGSFDIFILKLDAAGNFIWAEQMGGPGNDGGISIALDNLGNIYTMGDYYATADFDPSPATFNLTAQGISDVFIMKMNQNTTASIAPENSDNNTTAVFPNPFSGTFNIIIPALKNKNAAIEIYNSIGALVYNKQTTYESNEIELANQPSGIYFIKVMSDDKIITSKKIIKQ